MRRRAALQSIQQVGAVINGWFWLRRADLGRRVRLTGRPRVRVGTGGKMRIGQRVQLISTMATLELVAGNEATLEIGQKTLVNFGTSVVAFQRVTIGERCLIGPHCMVMDNSYHELDPDRRLEVPDSRPVTIEDNVWLGARVIVMPGVTIGRDSAIAAGSVVTSDIPSRTLAGGVPAKVIREL